MCHANRSLERVATPLAIVPVSSNGWRHENVRRAYSQRKRMRTRCVTVMGQPAFIAHTRGSTMQIPDDQVRGRTVVASDGQVVGEVSSLFVDTTTWSVGGLQIKLTKGIAEKLGVSGGLLRAATLEIPIRVVKSVGDAVLLSVPTLELHEEKP